MIFRLFEHISTSNMLKCIVFNAISALFRLKVVEMMIFDYIYG